jgi:hypothetical protein
VNLIEQKGGTKSDFSAFLFDLVNTTLDCVRVLKSGCLEVDALKSEAKTAHMDLADIQQELLTSKREQIEMFKTGVQKTLKNEMKTYSDAVENSHGDSLTLKKIKTVGKDVVEETGPPVRILMTDYRNMYIKKCVLRLTRFSRTLLIYDVVEDRNKNLMIFGLGKVEVENLC